MLHKLDVCRKESGKIWYRKPATGGDDGLMVSITHSAASSLAISNRNVRFLHAAFDVTGDCFVAGDHQGNIFLFDINRNKFTLTQRTGSACTAISFSLRRRSEFLVALSDYSLKCFDTDTKELVALMKGHESAINSISTHASGRYAITSSSDTAQLWDLDTFQRKRKLNVKENVDIAKVFFLPMSNTIMTCFKDDSIFAWESDTMQHKYQLYKPDNSKPANFRAFAASRDGRLLAAGGRSRHIHLWALDTKRLLRIIELPQKVTAVRQVVFLPDSFDGGANQVLGVLSQDGIMRFVNIHTCKLLFDIGSLDDQINSVTISNTGHHVAAVMDSGNINIYNVQALSSEISKPPPPLMKVLTGNKMEDSRLSGSKQRTTLGRKSGRMRRLGDKADTTNGSSEEKSQVDLPDGLSAERLFAILKGYGEYPAKYRMFIWRCLLRLPENHTAYAALVDKGTHPAYAKLHEHYPIKSRKLLRVLQRTLSALAHWSPIFGETDFLPMFAFPFVKLFQNNQLVCFELVATLLVNWAQHWFEYFPNPAINMLGMVENVLAYHDKELLQHLVRHGVTSQMYAWPLMETIFSEVLTKEEWMKLMDNVISNPPSFLLMLVAAYSTCSRAPLMRCVELDDFKFFFHHRNAVSVSQVISEAYRMMDTTPVEAHPQNHMEEFTPLTRGQYPVFNKYPKFIVDYQVQERERIRQEELEYLQQRQSSQELQKDTERRLQEEEAWYRQQKLLLDAEEKRRQLIAEEEQKLVDQRSRLAAMNREVKLKEMQLLDATRRKFMTHQQHQKEAQLTRLDDEIRRKAILRDVETATAVEDANIRNMELQLQKKMFEQELQREYVEADFKQKQDLESRRKQQEIEDQVARGVALAERDREFELRKAMQQNLAHAENVHHDATAQHQIELRQQLDDLDRERKALALSSVANENRRLERGMHDLMKEVQLNRESEAGRKFDKLAAQKKIAELAEMRRLELLDDEVDMARQHVDHIENTEHEMFERLRELRRVPDRYEDSDARNDGCLNRSNDTEVSTAFSLDRGRSEFEAREREVMADVRRLRAKLAKENREKRPPPAHAMQA